MPISVPESYQYCIRLSRTQARNFYYSFVCLPRPKRDAMCAIYAFMRESDDVSDDGEGDRETRMKAWREALDRAFEGDYGDSPIFPAFHDACRRYNIPKKYFHEVIDGTEMDLEPRRFETFAETYDYCYHVASVVGLVCIHVFEFTDPRALKLAEENGIAFQLTNILRDLREDAEMGRVYLPQEDLRRFGYTEQELCAGTDNAAFRELMRFEVERARQYYDRAAPLEAMIAPDSQPCLKAMRLIYRGILEAIVAQEYDVFSRRARVPTWQKLRIAMQAWWQSRRVREGRLSSA